MKRILTVVALVLLALAGASAARAEVVVPDYTAYLSAPGTGTVAGIAYGDEDVLRYSPTATPSWALHFDGSAAGLPAAADIDAYDYVSNAATFTAWHYMSFNQPVAVPGLGTVDDSDIVVYTTSLLGNSWSMYFDGSAHGLTTDAEDIDGLSISSIGFWISTIGGFNVPSINGTIVKGADQDMLSWINSLGNFSGKLKGTDFGILAENDLHNLAIAGINNASYVFMGLLKAQVMNGINAGGNDIVVEIGSVGSEVQSLFWDASASGFPKIDAVDVLFK